MAGVGGDQCVIGVDYGTLSGRAVVVAVADGAELGSAVHDYAHGVIERDAARVGRAPAGAMGAAGPRRLHRRAARSGAGGRRARPASRPSRSSGSRPTSPPRRRFRCSPTARRCAASMTCASARTPIRSCGSITRRGGQADRINALARERGEPWLPRYGGAISSEWEFAKGLQVLEEDPEVYERMERFVEAADWIVWQLCGRETRNTCTAGYKGIYQDGGYPSEDYLRALDERLRELRIRENRRPAGRPRRARGRPDRAGRAVDRAAGGDRRRGRQRRRTCHRARRAGDRSRSDARRHGHFDLPRHER